MIFFCKVILNPFHGLIWFWLLYTTGMSKIVSIKKYSIESMAISRESKTCRPCELVTITRVNAGFSHFSPIVGVFTHFSEAKSVNIRCYICIYARNTYSALPSQHLSKLPPNQVLNWLCHHKYFVGFACTKNITRVPITTLRPPNDFAWKSFPWTANIIKPFFSPSFQLNVNVMHSVAGALCLSAHL